ncbi:hypothetical protein FHT40_002714 [Mycolicibacterium sp. BK556]|uniref:hypothetical protein n=1 Tax=Mycobacteriaceae TaxID=1762 RepID=UPI0010611B10|nr:MULTISPECIES: hypothetical protein [Mycobacteriaceae]MBB3603053.1 hypothetical protein [Mycolicibacterium sp. BK556]MBB3633248.1 hypothetical protein [Mycolicibacterium sp. BK607]MBB3750804.1 hypothetical protein [Mycolicibacterium sp. BK634]
MTLGHAIQSLCGLTWFKRAFGAARATALTGVVLATAVLSACDAEVPDRSPAVDRLVQQIAAMPGVQTVSHTFNDRPAQDMVNFNVGVEVSDGITGDQLAAITSHYLSALASGAFNGYRAELDVRRGWNVFAVDSGNRAIANTDQIIGQARDWVDLRHEFNSATVELRATITHPDGPLEVREAGHSNVLRLSLPDPSDFATLADAVRMLSRNFLRLAGMEWTIHSGKLHPAEISFSRRFPSTAELDVWTRLNADQSIPHIDVLRINWSTTPPVWFSEKTIRSHDVSAALELAARHLPIVAELAAPILYSASDQLSGHIGGNGFARGPVAVTVGGCTPRDPLVYKPIPEEQALINRYAKCPS